MVIKYENNSELNCQNKFSLIMSDNIDRTVYNGFYIIIQIAVNMTILVINLLDVIFSEIKDVFFFLSETCCGLFSKATLITQNRP